MKKKLTLVLAAAMLTTTVLSGCGSSAKETEAQTIAAATTEAPTTEAATTAAEETAKPAAQEITFVVSNEPDGIDPGITNNSFASIFIGNCFEGLVTYDESGSVVPGSAESWDISDDGTVYTFHLRDGIKWNDGSDLTAEDFYYSYMRVLDPATGARYVNMLTDYIAGAADYYAGNAAAEEVGIKVVDSKTLEITLIKPVAYFIDTLTMYVYAPVQKATVEANGDSWTAKPETYISNGPLKVTEMNMGEGIVMEKNEYYWDAENVTIDKVNVRYILDTSTALTAYESGEVDGIRDIPASDFARLKAENAGIVSVPSFGTVYYDINCAKEPYNNPLVRKAINLAIDREAIINNVVQIDAEPAFNLISPGYAVDGVDLTEGRSTRELSPNADPEAAQAALAEAGYPNGEGFPTLQLSFYSNDTVKKVAESIAEMLKTNLNINVEVTSADWAVFYEDVQKGNYEIAAMGWSADYMHPMSFMPLLMTGDPNNHTGYSNPEYDALVNEIMGETDTAKAAEMIKEAEDMVMNDYPLLNLYYKANNFLMKDYVKGYYMTSSGHLYFHHASVEK